MIASLVAAGAGGAFVLWPRPALLKEAPPKGFKSDVDRDGRVTAWDACLLMSDKDGDGDVDLHDWAAWEGSFPVPQANTPAVLTHCTGMASDKGMIRVYAYDCYSGSGEVFLVAWPWPLELGSWIKCRTGPGNIGR